MKAPQEILEGLHVLLVSQDEQRTLTLSQALHERHAVVGDLKSSPSCPVTLRGADVLIIDTRTAPQTQPRVVELRKAGVARWASVVNLDFSKVVLDDGTLQFGLIELAIVPVTAADRALTERAKREEAFSTEILPLGPTRILQALSKVGSTLQLEMAPEPGFQAQLALSNDMLVNCSVTQDQQRFEGAAALARVLKVSDAEVRVTRLTNPSSMNLMEPLDQALRNATRERAIAAPSPRLPEEPLTKTLVPSPSNPFQAPGTTPGSFAVSAPKAPVAPAIPAGVKDMRIQPGRTMMGISPGVLPKPPAQAAAPTGQEKPQLPPAVMPAQPQITPAVAPTAAAPTAAARPVAVRPQGTDPVRGKTMMGIAPGSMPALGAFGVRIAPKPEPEAAPRGSQSPSAGAFHDDPALLQTVAPPSSLISELALEELALSTPENSQRELLPTMRAPAPSERELSYNESQAGSRVERITTTHELADLDNDLETDPSQLKPLPKAAGGQAQEPAQDGAHERETLEITTAVTQGEKMEQLMQEAARLREEEENLPHTGSTLGDDFKGFSADEQKPAASVPLATNTLVETESELAHSATTKALPVAVDESQEDTMYIERPKRKATKKGSNAWLTVLAAAALLGGGGYVYWARVLSSAGASAVAPVTAPVTAHAEAQRMAEQANVALHAAPPQQAPSAVPEEDESQAAAVAEVKRAAEPQAAVEAAPLQAAKSPAALAEADAPKALPTGPTDAPSAMSLDVLIKEGTRLIAEKNYAQAKTYFEAAVANDNKNAHAQAGLGQALLSLGQAAEAQAPIEAAIRLRGKRALYRVLLGDALKAQGKLEDARAAWEKALEIDPNDRDALKRLGR